MEKILKIIQWKVLKVTHLPVAVKEVQAGYLNSPYIKVVYLYLVQNKLPSHRVAVRRMETLAERYLLREKNQQF